jgi:hypothetical protein
VENLSVTVGSGSRGRNVQLGRQQQDAPEAEEEEDAEPQRQFRMPQYRAQQRLTLQLNYDYPLYNFIVVTLGTVPYSLFNCFTVMSSDFTNSVAK